MAEDIKLTESQKQEVVALFAELLVQAFEKFQEKQREERNVPVPAQPVAPPAIPAVQQAPVPPPPNPQQAIQEAGRRVFEPQMEFVQPTRQEMVTERAKQRAFERSFRQARTPAEKMKLVEAEAERRGAVLMQQWQPKQLEEPQPVPAEPPQQPAPVHELVEENPAVEEAQARWDATRDALREATRLPGRNFAWHEDQAVFQEAWEAHEESGRRLLEARGVEDRQQDFVGEQVAEIELPNPFGPPPQRDPVQEVVQATPSLDTEIEETSRVMMETNDGLRDLMANQRAFLHRLGDTLRTAKRDIHELESELDRGVQV